LTGGKFCGEKRSPAQATPGELIFPLAMRFLAQAS
jgi:hypothetical protein